MFFKKYVEIIYITIKKIMTENYLFGELSKLSFLLSLESANNLEAAAKDLRLIVLNESDLLNVLTLCCFSSFPHTEDDTIPPFDMNMSDFFSYAY